MSTSLKPLQIVRYKGFQKGPWFQWDLFKNIYETEYGFLGAYLKNDMGGFGIRQDDANHNGYAVV